MQMKVYKVNSVQSHNVQRYTGVKSYLQVFQTGLRFIYSFPAILFEVGEAPYDPDHWPAG